MSFLREESMSIQVPGVFTGLLPMSSPEIALANKMMAIIAFYCSTIDCMVYVWYKQSEIASSATVNGPLCKHMDIS